MSQTKAVLMDKSNWATQKEPVLVKQHEEF